MKSKAPLGATLIVFSSLVYASYGVWITYMGNGFGSFIQGAIRGAIVVILLLPIVVKRKDWVSIRWKQDAWWLLGLAIASALIVAPLYYAVLKIGVGLATGILYGGLVLGSFIFGWLIGKEPYSKDKWLATILGIAGIWLVFIPHSGKHAVLGILAALISGLASGLILVLNKYIKYGVTQTTVLTWSSTVVACIFPALLLHEHVPKINDHRWLFLLIYSVASLVASYTVIKGVKLIEAGAASVLGLLEIIFGVLYGFLIFNQRLHTLALVGLGLILVAAAIPYYREFKQTKIS